MTEGAARTLLRIVGEQPDVPDEKLGEQLTRVASDYKRLQAQVAAAGQTAALVAKAQEARDAQLLGRRSPLRRRVTLR